MGERQWVNGDKARLSLTLLDISKRIVLLTRARARVNPFMCMTSSLAV